MGSRSVVTRSSLVGSRCALGRRPTSPSRTRSASSVHAPRSHRSRCRSRRSRRLSRRSRSPDLGVHDPPMRTASTAVPHAGAPPSTPLASCRLASLNDASDLPRRRGPAFKQPRGSCPWSGTVTLPARSLFFPRSAGANKARPSRSSPKTPQRHPRDAEAQPGHQFIEHRVQFDSARRGPSPAQRLLNTRM